MGNITARLSLLSLVLLGSCAWMRPVFFERGDWEGCMYYRGRIVPISCIDEMVRVGSEGGYSFAALSRCLDGVSVRETRSLTRDVAPFVREDGVMEPMAACRFDGVATRSSYHFDGVSRLYRRFITCRDGCRMVSDLHEIRFEGNLIFTTQLTRIEQ